MNVGRGDDIPFPEGAAGVYGERVVLVVASILQREIGSGCVRRNLVNEPVNACAMNEFGF